MPKHPLEVRAEAIALAAISGAEAAAEAMGLDPRTVRKWSEQAGRAPELVARPDEWKRLHDLAIAKVTNDLVSGRMKPRDTAVIAAIARRNLSKPDPTADPRTPTEQAVDGWEAWMAEHLPGESVSAGFAALIEWMEGQEDDAAITDEAVHDYLLSIVPLSEWLSRRSAERTAAWQAQLELNRIAAAEAQRRDLDAETQALVEAAEAWLRETAQ